MSENRPDQNRPRYDVASGASYEMLEMRWPGRQGVATGTGPARVDPADGTLTDDQGDRADLADRVAFDVAAAEAFGALGRQGLDEIEAAAFAQQAAGAPAAEPGASAAPSFTRRCAERLSNPHAATYILAACIALLVALTMLGGLLNVGDHLMAAHPAIGWLFYALLAAVVVAGVVYPLVKIAQRPVFSLYQLRDETGHAKARRCRMLVDNLVANTDLTDGEVARLEGYLMAGDEADDLLIAFFNEKCVPAIDAETKRAATTAFFASAISRSPLIATVTMLSVCLDLVRAIVQRCGFRPTNLGLARLYARVMLSALVAGGIEDSDLSDMLGTLLGGGAGARMGGIVLGSATEGLVSAFLVFRVGVITKRWLTSEDGPAQMAAIRRVSYREALALMRTSGFMAAVTDVIKRNVGTVATSAATSFTDVAKNAAETTVGFARSTANTAASAARSAVETTVDAARSTTEAARSAFASGAEAVQRIGSSAIDSSRTAFALGVDEAARGVETTAMAVTSGAEAVATSVAHAAGSAVGAAAGIAGNAGAAVRRTTAAVGEGFGRATDAARKGVGSIASGIGDAFRDAFKGNAKDRDQ